MRAPDEWRPLPIKTRVHVGSGSREPFAAIGNAMDPALGPDRLVVAGPFEREVIEKVRTWLRSDDVREDHLADLFAEHFAQPERTQ